MATRLHNYAEVRAYLEKAHPDWLRAFTPLHINAPADYWPQKVLAVSQRTPRCGTTSASMSTKPAQSRARCSPGPGGASPTHDMPTPYVSLGLPGWRLLRPELPDGDWIVRSMIESPNVQTTIDENS
jgi:hypothetical protein